MSSLTDRLKAKRPRVAGLTRREWLAAVGAALPGAAHGQLLLPGGLTLGTPHARAGWRHTTKLFANPFATGASGYTFLLQTGSEVPFDWVRLVYMNHTASAYTIGAATVAASAHAPSNNYTAVKADGTTNAPTAVTFNNGGEDGSPPAPSGATGTLVVAAGSTAPATLAFSDWMQIPSISPDDGGTFHHLLVRTYVSSGAPSMVIPTPIAKVSTDFPPVSGGRNLKSNYASGNQSAAATMTALGPAAYLTPVAVQFYSRKRGLTVLDIGDSLTQGLKATADHESAGFQAVRALSTPAFPLFYVNEGYSGMTSPNFYAKGLYAVDKFAPDIAMISIFSPNDGTATQASCDASFDRAMAFAQYCRDRKVIPILKTALPWGSTDTTTDFYRRSINARAVNQGSVPVADISAAITDGANPERIQIAFDSGDHLHPNGSGYAKMAMDVIVPLLSRLAA